jgi:hypothetical protein
LAGVGLALLSLMKGKNMKKITTKFAAIVQTPVFPKTLHQFRPVLEAIMSSKPTKRDNIFSKSRDVVH